ncbi:3-oxo-isoapionate kinase OiaK [Methylobacterium nodulans]|uniref:Type III effector Hrp-dependent outers n=1 Tax=Methylobacterium nodulans (strain LMG 21967 / CNCM I-2342 / ORS 2060) TaxID=460265 RepID=B8IBH5_METNO|nr:3-oxo-isoapionate kinase OiaK [Methylobacterium nodulans]ACL57390.1 type III effector Hrp-dependent outers [Methylobacterium nodulans ORS 2060]
MSGTGAWPEGLLLAYYGDDFTGSTDAMEALTAAGVPTVLFLEAPDARWLARFPHARCIGLAGSSRGRSPEWMDRELPGLFAGLARLGAPILHYKVCSTFDSSPETGSIGRAVDIGVGLMPGRWSPMIVGAPRLKRYQAFGNLFAVADGVGYRLDRHPTMARHPVTPMREADLRRHLGRQTTRRIELIDFVALKSGAAPGRRAALAGPDVPVVLIDVLDEETLAEAGRLVWEERGGGVFSASSSGLQYALAAHWRAQGLIPAIPSLPPLAPAPVVAAVSGSCSPGTAEQLARARAAGFLTERLDLARALRDASRDDEIARVTAVATRAIADGVSPIVFSAEGPDDPAVTGFDATAAEAGLSRGEAARQVGAALAEVMRRIIACSSVRRVAVAGGDSSGEVMGALGIKALEIAAALAPGAPLCRAYADDATYDGLELVLKGGQMGDADFFEVLRAGRDSS